MKNKICKISAELNTKILSYPEDKIPFDNIVNGKLGLIYYSLCMFRVTQDSKFLDKISSLLNDIFSNFPNKDSIVTSPIFSNGISGWGMILNDLIKYELVDIDFEEHLDAISDTVFQQCLILIKMANNFDFLHGPVGILHYLVSVGKYEYSNIIVEELLGTINSNFYDFYNNVEDKYTQGITFGLAHGLAAMMTVLLNLYKMGHSEQNITHVLANIYSVILKYRNITSIDNCKVNFPYNIYKENNILVSRWNYRLAWCNSDLCVALALYKAGAETGDQNYNTLADEIAGHTLNRKTFKVTRIEDYHFCHGSSGVAMLYSKIYEITKSQAFYEAYLYWINETVNYLEKDLNVPVKHQHMELLTGWLGAILTINTINHSEIKDWSSIFLI